MMIKVLGSGCASCSQLLTNVERALLDLDMDVDVEFVHDIAQVLKYEVLQLPALVIDEKVISFGSELSVLEVKETLKKYHS